MTCWTGKRTSTRFRSEAMWTFSRWCSRLGPWYHGMFAERETTLSPLSAEMGTTVRSGTSSLVVKAQNSFSMRLKVSSS